MPVTIAIENERRVRGDEIHDTSDVVIGLIGRAHKAGKTLRVLGYVDPYGDTVLNALQQDAALADLDDLDALARSVEESKLINKLRSLLKDSRRAPHQYVRFVGD
jgi:hypothetical protein